jgi:hypothetical protein
VLNNILKALDQKETHLAVDLRQALVISDRVFRNVDNPVCEILDKGPTIRKRQVVPHRLLVQLKRRRQFFTHIIVAAKSRLINLPSLDD